MAKRSLLILVCLLLTDVAFAQSRTEEARKRLDGEHSSTGISTLFAVIELTAEFMPEFFYFRALHPDEPRMRYNPAPFRNPNGNGAGIRNFSGYADDGKSQLLQLRLNTSMPQGSLAMEQFAMEATWHIGYWAINSRYEQLREAAAPYPIRQFNAVVGRKFRFLENGDAGLYLGVRSLGIGSSNYLGPELLTNFSWYFKEPFSLNYTYSSMAQRYGFIRNHEFGAGIHRGQLHFALTHRWLDILGIHFRTLSFGVGVNF
ncbi:MAG: hypothetical protein JJU41_00385 [Bacteroidetes bacterium]|nr:hypothetical protein [Bacteroidota bacterium]MCH8525312.1 hypothetical protein [Balneolales bacterium]